MKLYSTPEIAVKLFEDEEIVRTSEQTPCFGENFGFDTLSIWNS